MNALRALMLMLVAGWSATSGGLAGALHICQMAEAPTACVCPHAEKTRSDGMQLERAECCDVQVTFAASVPAVSDHARFVFAFAAPALAPSWRSPPALAETWHPRPFEGPAPPSHGPPVFLKVRSLLI